MRYLNMRYLNVVDQEILRVKGPRVKNKSFTLSPEMKTDGKRLSEFLLERELPHLVKLHISRRKKKKTQNKRSMTQFSRDFFCKIMILKISQISCLLEGKTLVSVSIII